MDIYDPDKKATRSVGSDGTDGLKSIGECGSTPLNTTGATMLYYLCHIWGRLHQPDNAVIDTVTPLGANATFNGVARDFGHSRLGYMGCIAFADEDSASNGFKIQQSIDAVNWDLNTGATSVSADVAISIRQAVVGRYCRVVYTNGTVIQGAFRIGSRFMIA